MNIISKWKSHGLGNIHLRDLRNIEIGFAKKKFYSSNDRMKNTSCLTNLKTI